VTELEVRQAEIAGIDFPNRTIELIVMPYEKETPTAVVNGRQVTEIVSRGAFDGVEQRTSQVKVNRGHVLDMVVGKTLALHPSREEGLVAEVRISRTELGEETLVLADDGILAASAGFGLMRKGGMTGAVVPHAEVWESRDRRRLNHLFLHHIAMTPDPAYEDARVLAVRAAVSAQDAPIAVEATPNMDRLQLEHWRAVMADLDRRYPSKR
jgi:HK97 family phage prohead protease